MIRRLFGTVFSYRKYLILKAKFSVFEFIFLFKITSILPGYDNDTRKNPANVFAVCIVHVSPTAKTKSLIFCGHIVHKPFS